jgi:hypothetical protein
MLGTWSARCFPSQGSTSFQNSLTLILESSLSKLKSHDLNFVGRSGSSLLLMLTTGISNFIDSGDPRIRRHAFRVATKFSALVGVELRLPVEQLEGPLDSNKELGVGTEDGVPRTADDSVSDNDELEPYEDVEILPNFKPLTYLRDCLNSKTYFFQVLMIPPSHKS